MLYKEVNGDLFSAPQGYCLAHCIAGDFGMGAGIATQFNDKFNMRNRLINSFGEAGNLKCIKIDNVFNLITKDYSYRRPTYDSLLESLVEMRDLMVADGNKKLAIPQIGCGLDGLKWDVVRALIKDVFEKTDIEIVVYIYKEEIEDDEYYNDKEELPDMFEGQMTFDDYNYGCDRCGRYDDYPSKTITNF